MAARVGDVFTIYHLSLPQIRGNLWLKTLRNLQSGDLLEIHTRPEGKFDYVYVVFRELQNNNMVVDSCCYELDIGLLVPLQYLTRVTVIDGASARRAKHEVCGATFHLALADML